MMLPVAGALLLGSAFAAEPSTEVLRAWSEMNHVSVRITTAQGGDYQQFYFDITPQHDLRVRVEDSAKGQATKGSVMLIGEHALLVKDLPLERGEEIDAIDSPALILQLIDKLLAASGKAPREIRGKLPLDIQETSWDLSVASASAEAEYPAPWTLHGSLESQSDGAIAFDFVHAFRTEDVPVEIHYRGVWQKAAKPIALDDAMSLAGWQAFSLGPTTHSDGHGGTAYDFGVKAIEPAPKTLQDVRKVVAEQAKAQKEMPTPAPNP